MRRTQSILTVLLAFGAGAFTAHDPDSEAWPPMGFTFEMTVEVPATPEVAWDHFTGDVSGWWDIHLAEKPKSLTIGRKPGSSFLEVFDDAGNGAEHARVTHAVRGKMLRMVGPLVFVDDGVVIDSTLRFAAKGNATEVKLTAHGSGKVDDMTVSLVERVWQRILVKQYAPWVRRQ